MKWRCRIEDVPGDRLRQRFFSLFSASDPCKCWEWRGSISSSGYGSMRFGVNGHSISLYAHRVSHYIHAGGIPEGMLVIHSCDNPKCVNPEHLRSGTHQDNTDDMVKRGRQRFDAPSGTKGLRPPKRPRKTHCKNGHEFTPENTYWRLHLPSSRACRQCTRDAGKRWRSRQK